MKNYDEEGGETQMLYPLSQEDAPSQCDCDTKALE